MDLEQARDDVMYEVYKMQTNSEYDLNVCFSSISFFLNLYNQIIKCKFFSPQIMKAYFSEIDKLSQELAKQLWLILDRVLDYVRGVDPGPQQLITALRIIEREER